MGLRIEPKTSRLRGEHSNHWVTAAALCGKLLTNRDIFMPTVQDGCAARGLATSGLGDSVVLRDGRHLHDRRLLHSVAASHVARGFAARVFLSM